MARARGRAGGGETRLRRRLEAALRALPLRNTSVLVAVSGGVDSMTLLHALAERAPAHGLRLAVGHVHHGLRGAAADADAALVRDAARALGLPHAEVRVDPRAAVAAAPSSRSRPTLQEAARRLRREALCELAEELGAAHVATAHTADDQAETVLLRLVRGAGPAGLAGIPPRSPDGRFVRPFLHVAREDVLAYASARGIAWREDASNADPRYGRSRMRPWVAALRAEFNPRLLRAIGELADAVREESVWLEARVELEARRRFQDDEQEAGALWIDPKDWDAERLPDALARRLVRRALHRVGAGRDVSRAHLERALAFLRSAPRGRTLELPGGWRLARADRGFRLARVSLPSAGAC